VRRCDTARIWTKVSTFSDSIDGGGAALTPRIMINPAASARRQQHVELGRETERRHAELRRWRQGAARIGQHQASRAQELAQIDPGRRGVAASFADQVLRGGFGHWGSPGSLRNES
jgi:hypothetical protein